MLDKEALYRAICLFPYEDVPRLAYADLIEEEGDSERAAFIREQVEAARLADSNYGVKTEECLALEARAAARYQKSYYTPAFWVPHLIKRRYPGKLEDTFRRGFAYRRATSCREYIQHHTQYHEEAPLQALEISGSLDATGEPFEKVRDLLNTEHPGIDTLALDGMFCRDTQTLRRLQAIAGMEHLRTLDLEGAFIGTGPDGAQKVQTIAGMTQLRSLDLAGNTLVNNNDGQEEANIQAISQMTHLYTLGLANNYLGAGRRGLAHIEAIARLKHLRTLDLSDNDLFANGQGHGLAKCRAIASMPHLHTLDLSRNLPGHTPPELEMENDNAITRLNAITGMKSLRRLALRTNYIGAGTNTLAQVKSIARMQWLEVLDLSGNSVGCDIFGDGPQQVKALTGMKNLRSLNLRSNSIGVGDRQDEKIFLLAHANMPLLHTLDVQKNAIEIEDFLRELEKAYQETIRTNGKKGSMISLTTLNDEPLPENLVALRDEAKAAYEAYRRRNGAEVGTGR